MGNDNLAASLIDGAIILTLKLKRKGTELNSDWWLTWKEESSSPRWARVPMMGIWKCEAARDTWKTIDSLARARMATGLCDDSSRHRSWAVWFIHHSPETMTLSIWRRSFHLKVPRPLSSDWPVILLLLLLVANVRCHVRPPRSLFKEARFFCSTRDMVSMSAWSKTAMNLTVSTGIAAGIWATDMANQKRSHNPIGRAMTVGRRFHQASMYLCNPLSNQLLSCTHVSIPPAASLLRSCILQIMATKTAALWWCFSFLPSIRIWFDVW